MLRSFLRQTANQETKLRIPSQRVIRHSPKSGFTDPYETYDGDKQLELKKLIETQKPPRSARGLP